MGMFGDLMNKIFRNQANAERPFDAAPPPRPTINPGGPVAPGTNAPMNAPAGNAGNVDVAAILTSMAASNDEKLDWKRSIVDLLKLVGMDSSLTARKALAAELNYTGDTDDSATMNIWLHKAVMKKLADNGGKVPADLLDN